MKECGTCSLCCKLFTNNKCDSGTEAFPFDKPAGQWCRYFQRGKGCTLHGTAEFPNLCKVYKCEWLGNSNFPDQLRPDLVHVIVDTHSASDFVDIRAIFDPDYPPNNVIMSGLKRNAEDGLLVRITNSKDREETLLCSDGTRIESYEKESH